ncbi:o-succinylbenzoate synthase [Pontiella desulfatans]|uniref:O-succinylbenzoate synthase n=1 Tax=Pontiella desulfatans TaxID=2750659 RepID=A0A6C2UEJ8_PONDE|nr:mandelate racemase/muconate lactonizing enzyme family protein [Pontiella desulfatans]VGO17794.1 o-succinylbenzoate synthase [Pontiella desulfatans]
MKIETVEVFPLEYPTKGYFKFFTTPLGHSGRPAVMIKLTTADGLVGWGQAVPIATWCSETLEASVIALKNYYAPSLIGQEIETIADAHLIMEKAIRPEFSTSMPLTRAGIDMALHDLFGKAQGQSLAELWGRPRRGRMELSWTVNVTSLDGVGESVNAGKRLGYRHFNVKVAPDPVFDLEVVKMVRDAAPDGFLWTDANTAYTVDDALSVAPKLADLGVQVFESPLPPNRISGYQALKKQGALDVYMDEGVVSPVELEEFIKLGMLDGMAMKPSRCGGLTSNKRQIELCMEHGLKWVGSGLCDPDLSLGAALSLYDAFGLPEAAALNGPQFLDASVLKNPVVIENAVAEVPDGPGLGLEVDEEKLNALSAETAERWGLK